MQAAVGLALLQIGVVAPVYEEVWPHTPLTMPEDALGQPHAV